MEKLLFKRVELWFVLLLLVLLVVPVIVFGALVRNHAMGEKKYGKAGEIALAIAEIPSVIRKISKGGQDLLAHPSDEVAGKSGWAISENAGAMKEMLLVSRYDGDLKRHVIELTDLGTGEVKHRWTPDAGDLLKGASYTTGNVAQSNWTARRFRYIHPFLGPDGSLLLKDHSSPLVKVGACGNMQWRNSDLVFHHSIEAGANDTQWVAGRYDPSVIDGAPDTMMDDALVQVGGNGEILYQKSLGEIFIENGLTFLVFARGAFTDDPFHLNDIQPILADGPHWKKGDLLVNIRNQSMVMLYRPSTGKIIWSKQGPWMAEHDVDILDDHTIALFSNNAVRMRTNGNGHVQGTNNIIVYDFDTDQVSRPWTEIFERENIKTETEGLFQFAAGGQLLVEEENQGRILLFSPEGEKFAEFVNRASDDGVYRLGWSRLIDPATARAALNAIAAADCSG